MPGQAPPLTDERELLLAYIAQQRDRLRYAAYGLTDEQARLTPTAGTLSIAGLVKHVTRTEQGWIDLAAGRDRGASREEQEAAYPDSLSLGPGETLADVLTRLDQVAKETEAAVAEGWPATEWLTPWEPPSS